MTDLLTIALNVAVSCHPFQAFVDNVDLRIFGPSRQGATTRLLRKWCVSYFNPKRGRKRNSSEHPKLLKGHYLSLDIRSMKLPICEPAPPIRWGPRWPLAGFDEPVKRSAAHEHLELEQPERCHCAPRSIENAHSRPWRLKD